MFLAPCDCKCNVLIPVYSSNKHSTDNLANRWKTYGDLDDSMVGLGWCTDVNGKV